MYVGVNLVLWSIWIIGGIASQWIFPWPIFPTIFWGLFVVGQANDLYWRDTLSEDQVQREVERLEIATRTRPIEAYDDRADDWWWPGPAGFWGRGRGRPDDDA